MMGHTSDDPPWMWRALDELTTRVVDKRAQIAALQAEEAQLLNAAADLVLDRTAQRRTERRQTANDMALREVTSELGAAMRLSDRTVQARMSDAATLMGSFPSTHEQWSAGRIDAAHVAAILDPGASIQDPAARVEYEKIVLEAAKHETPPRLRAIARVVAARLDPATVEELQRRARQRRRVRVVDLGDGMARLLADLPAVLAHAIADRLTEMAHEAQTTADAAPACRDLDGVADENATSGDSASADDAEPDDHTGGVPDEGPSAGDTEPDHGTVTLTTGPAKQPTPGAAAGARASDDLGVDASPATESADGARGGVGDGSAFTPGVTPACVGDGRPVAKAELRTMDELRADILADILLTGAPTGHGDALAAITAHVQITVPVLTAAGVGSEPALLAGYGPIDTETARRLAGGAPGWDRVMFHPHTGAPLAVDRYRSSAELKRFLRVRDEHCRFPGCMQPPWRCDLDHTVDAAHGGPTSECNLAHFCRRHHTIKHATAWRVRQLGGGELEWISLTGRRYVDRPVSTVQFVPSIVPGRPHAPPDEDPPPF